MALLLPESGLLFWMLLSFGIIVFILAIFGFPVIIKMVEDRKAYIDESLLSAQKAYDDLAKVKDESLLILDNARKEHIKILNEASQSKEMLIKDAKEKASIEASKLIAEARKQILLEKEDAIRGQLEKKTEQMDMINRLLDEINVTKS